MDNALLGWALHYAAHGWRVFPCHTPKVNQDKVTCSCGKADCDRIGKHPRWHEGDLTNGLKDATTDESQIRTWWARWPDANVAIAAGRESGLIVLDIDGSEGAASLAGREIPETYEVKTGNGTQLYFAYPPLTEGQRIITKSKVLPGVDSRGDLNGYVVAPPSLHASGVLYEVRKNIVLAAAPPWWLELVTVDDTTIPTPSMPPPPGAPVTALSLEHLNGHRHYVEAALKSELDKLRNTPIGEQNEQLNRTSFAIGQFVGAGCVTMTQAEEMILEVVLSLPCAPGRKAWTRKNALPTLKSGLADGMRQPRKLPEPDGPAGMLRGPAARLYIEQGKTSVDEEPQEDEESEEAFEADTTTYAVRNGRIVFSNVRKMKDGSEDGNKGVVCDFAATITEQIIPEDGPGFYRIEGRAARGGFFQVEISTDEYSDDRKLKAKLQSAAGAQSPVRAGMIKHLGPAISLLTGRKLIKIHSYSRTGWAREYDRRGELTGREFFLIPGRESVIEAHGAIQHVSDPPYCLEEAASLEKGQKALRALLKAQSPAMACVAAAFAFQAPLAHLAGWRNERYGLFITGQTGSFKSSWAQVLMCLYGPEFLNDASLLKFGQGATINALANIATLTHDMPIMVDNYKPNTGKGSDDFVNVIHNILEGAEKRRMKDYKLLAPKPIYCWPLITGEDVPENDAASLARILVVQFTWPKGEDNPQLSFAQDNASHLCAIGRAWIDFLESPEGRAAAETARKRFPDARNDWRSVLRKNRLEMANPLRVASNLATNELTWWTMKQCPALSKLLDEFTDTHIAGLLEVASSMAHQTSEATEASKFLSVLRELLSTERAVIAPYGLPVRPDDRERLLGWRDNADPKNVLLIPNTAREKVLRILGQGGLNNISKTALTRQLKQIGALVDHDAGRGTKKAKPDVTSGVQDFLCIRGDFLFPPPGDEDETQGSLPINYP